MKLSYSTVLGAYVADAASSSTVMTTGTDGTAKLLYLAAGTYIVTETQAPSGYNLDSTPVEITITNKTSQSAPLITTVKNSPIMSKTGETGSDLMITGGMLLLIACVPVTAIIVGRRRKEKEKQ